MVQQMPWGRKDPQCQPLVHHTLALVILPLRCLTLLLYSFINLPHFLFLGAGTATEDAQEGASE